MTGTRPPFIRVVPGEVERHGLAAAVVLAHIRFRCETDGPPGLVYVEIDGSRWWLVSRRELGHEVGLSADAVKRALAKLGSVVASANNPDDYEDRKLAYRVPAVDDALIGQKAESPRSDVPKSGIAQPHGENAVTRGDFAQPKGRNRPTPEAESPSALPRETLETKAGDPPDPLSNQPPALERLPSRRTGSEIARAKFSATPVADNSAFAKRIARAYSDSLPVPIEAGVLAKIGVEADKCLRSQIAPDAIAAGIREWANSDSWSPTQISTFVAKAAARVARTADGIGKPTENALGYQAAGEALIARMESA